MREHLEFRPHHFLCALGFEGKGYSPGFVANFQAIADRLRAPGGGEVRLRVVSRTDSVCAPCPSRRGDLCESQAKIDRLDEGHARALNLAAGQVLTWTEAQARVRTGVSDEVFEEICAPCSWKSLGVCQAALRRLRTAGFAFAFTLAFASGSALAKPKTSPKAAPSATPAPQVQEEDEEDAALQPRPLDLIQEEVREHHSKRAKSLRKAYEALLKRKFDEAIRLAADGGKDPGFADYTQWISAAAHQGAGVAALGRKNYAEAARRAQKALDADFLIETKSPYSPMLRNVPREAGLAEVLLGEALAGSRKWAASQEAFERGFQRLITHGAMGLVKPSSLEAYARACDADAGELCGAWIDRLALFYSKNSEEMRAILKVLPDTEAPERLPVSGGNARATQTYRAPDLDQASFEANLALYLDGKFSPAIQGLQKFVDEFPKSAFRFRARYWLGQAYLREKELDKGRRVLLDLQRDSPLTYYGMLAAFDTDQGIDSAISATVPMAIERDPLLHPHELNRLVRAERFIAEGASDLAAQELRDFRARDGLSSPFLMYLASLQFEARAYATAFTLLGDLSSRGFDGAASSSFLRMIFPLAYMDLVRKHADASGLDPILVLSLIKQESAFEVGAISSSGALGLMQLMPMTASDTDPKIQRVDLVEADHNIRVGTKYLKSLMTRFNGNIVLSLAGYNAGPNAADRWFKAAPAKRTMLEFIETIPYKETREYVASIIRNYFWYSKRINGSGVGDSGKSLSYFWNVYGPPEKPAALPEKEDRGPSSASKK